VQPSEFGRSPVDLFTRRSDAGRPSFPYHVYCSGQTDDVASVGAMAEVGHHIRRHLPSAYGQPDVGRLVSGAAIRVDGIGQRVGDSCSRLTACRYVVAVTATDKTLRASRRGSRGCCARSTSPMPPDPKRGRGWIRANRPVFSGIRVRRDRRVPMALSA